jgi:hypothetical protein
MDSWPRSTSARTLGIAAPASPENPSADSSAGDPTAGRNCFAEQTRTARSAMRAASALCRISRAASARFAALAACSLVNASNSPLRTASTGRYNRFDSEPLRPPVNRTDALRPLRVPVPARAAEVRPRYWPLTQELTRVRAPRPRSEFRGHSVRPDAVPCPDTALPPPTAHRARPARLLGRTTRPNWPACSAISGRVAASVRIGLTFYLAIANPILTLPNLPKNVKGRSICSPLHLSLYLYCASSTNTSL